MCVECLIDLSAWLKPAVEKLQVTICSNSTVREVVVGTKPTRGQRTVEAGADVALEQEQHCWHVVPYWMGVQLTLDYG